MQRAKGDLFGIYTATQLKIKQGQKLNDYDYGAYIAHAKHRPYDERHKAAVTVAVVDTLNNHSRQQSDLSDFLDDLLALEEKGKERDVYEAYLQTYGKRKSGAEITDMDYAQNISARLHRYSKEAARAIAMAANDALDGKPLKTKREVYEALGLSN